MPLIPEPKTYPIIGHIPYLSKGFGGCLIDSFDKLHAQFGSIFSLNIVGRKWIVCSDPLIMKKALIENLAIFPKGSTLEAAHSLEIGKSGLTETEGPDWINQHKLLKPFFMQKSVHSTFIQIQQVMDKSIIYLNINKELEILDFCNRVSFCFMTKMSSSYESNCLNNIKNIDPLFKLQSHVVSQFLNRVKYSKYSKYIPTISNILFEKRLSEYRKFFKKIIHNFEQNNSHSEDVILYHLINGKYGERKLTENEIIDQLYTVIGAGYESTGATLHWLLYELSKRQDLIKELRNEIAIYGHYSNWNSEIISKCELLQITLLEIFRLHPVFPVLVREVASDIEINNFMFTEKAFVFFNTGQMHTDSFWGEDAKLFRPERFLEKNNIEGYKEHFFPFGIGPRKCIGEKMAKSELAVMIMRILIEYDLELIPGQKIIPFQSLTRVSKNGIKMKFTKRSIS